MFCKAKCVLTIIGQMSSFLRQGLEYLPQAVPQRKRRNEPRLVGKPAQKAKPFVLRVCFSNSRKPVFAENDTICDCVKQKPPE